MDLDYWLSEDVNPCPYSPSLAYLSVLVILIMGYQQCWLSGCEG